MSRKLTKRQMQILRRSAASTLADAVGLYPELDSTERHICERLEQRGYLVSNVFGGNIQPSEKGWMLVKVQP